MPSMTGKTRAQVDLATLEAERSRRLSEVENWLNSTLAAGFSYGGYTWQADERAQSIALATLVMSAFPIEWRNRANEMIPFSSPSDFAPFAAAMKAFVNQTYATVFARKDALRAATTLAELEEVQL